MSVTQKAVDFVIGTSFESLPGHVVNEARRVLIDAVGCGFAGYCTGKGSISAETAPQLAGAGDCTIIGKGNSFAPAAAAFANAELIHAMDFCALTDPPAHVTPFVIPPLLALAQMYPVSGADLLLAIGTAHELSYRLGLAISEPVLNRYGGLVGGGAGFSMTVAAAALAGSRMIGLDAAKTTNALGIAAYLSPVAGTMRFIEARSGKVAMTKMAPAGWMAQAGLTAVLWAANGYVGDQEIFDGEPNYGKFLGMPGWKPEAFLDRLGEEWVIGDGMVYKQFPCGMPGHPILEAAIDAMRSNDIRASDVEEIVIWSTASTPIFENKKVTQQLEVQFSVPYMLALSALGIPPGVEWFDEKYMTDPEVNALMSKVHIAFNKDSNDAVAAGSRRRRWSAMVDVVAKGSTFRSEKIVAKGDPSTPETRTTDDELKQKFHFNLRHVDRADASDIADATWNLDRYAQASSVIRMFGS